MMQSRPICHVVAGPNGSGKSTFALRYLPRWAGNVEFVNPDLIAQGESPLDIRLSAFEAGKRALRRIRAIAAAGTSFAFETTLSGRAHLTTLEALRATGYGLSLYYLWIPDPAALPMRIRHRVLLGGHDVPAADVLRRFARSRANLAAYAARTATGAVSRPRGAAPPTLSPSSRPSAVPSRPTSGTVSPPTPVPASPTTFSTPTKSAE